ncbi:MAG TPA: ribosome small subunit-dependent GTPase A [Micrococcales bacterium]|uniref:ribosome small subunit-dependent GTPase A n=1 Tax=Miniimonas arenae TaxID=676201 RepID=UPI000ECF5B71|nr:ribosome small subunit-dependent GTPase A [Miniimonas arenae]HCX84125.1 ribosome small subunit-dependent GTPase A [Micrococcales bacterium]
MRSRGTDLDESDVRVRPRRGGSRPRTKQRPAYAGAVEGFVTGVNRGRYDVLAEGRAVIAVTARELGRGGVVVGDRVRLVGDLSGARDTLARIVSVAERETLLRRSSEDTGGVERALVANADQLVVVTALADPEPRTRMVDRCLVAAFDAGMDTLLCLTKSDLAPAEPFLAGYDPLDVPAVVTQRTESQIVGLDGEGGLRELLAGRISVLMGHSGVGKSTLVNALVPHAQRAVGHVNAVTGRGRHTSTSAVALALPGGGWVIDTPGVRSLGLGHVDVADVIAAFPDLAEITTACPRGCTHLAGAPGCALDVALARPADPRLAARVESLRRLLSSRLGEDEPARRPERTA